MKRNLLKMIMICQCVALAFFSCENKEEASLFNEGKNSVKDLSVSNNAYEETAEFSDQELMDYIHAKSKEYGVDICALSEQGYQSVSDSLLNMCLFNKIENNAFVNETIELLREYLIQMEEAMSNEDTLAMEDAYVHIYNVLNCEEYVSLKDIILNGEDMLVAYSDFVRGSLLEIEKTYPNFQRLTQTQKEDVIYLADVYSEIKLNNAKAAPIDACQKCKRDYNRSKSIANAKAMVELGVCMYTGPMAGYCCAGVLAILAIDLGAILDEYSYCVRANC